MKNQDTSRHTFITLFQIIVVALIFMPFLTTFNDILTRIVISMKGYSIIRDYIVPFEIKMIVLILNVLGFNATGTSEYVILGRDSPFFAEIIWNCIGWQSLLFFVITAIVGLQGDKYTLMSKLKAFVIGILGTFLINIFRIVIVVISAYLFGQIPAQIIHDYASLLGVIGWLFFFWWFVYSFVLEDRKPTVQEEVMKV